MMNRSVVKVMLGIFLVTGLMLWAIIYKTNQWGLSFITQKTAPNYSICSSVSNISQLECQALVDIYYYTNGLNRTNKTNRLETSNPCDWYGILCNIDQTYVQKIALHNNNLEGIIPYSIGNFSHVSQILLSNNKIQWNIPSSITNLGTLEILQLYENKLSWKVPDFLAQLNLITFHIWKNYFDRDASYHAKLSQVLQAWYDAIPNWKSNNYQADNIAPIISNLTSITDLSQPLPLWSQIKLSFSYSENSFSMKAGEGMKLSIAWPTPCNNIAITEWSNINSPNSIWNRSIKIKWNTEGAYQSCKLIIEDRGGGYWDSFQHNSSSATIPSFVIGPGMNGGNPNWNDNNEVRKEPAKEMMSNRSVKQ